LQAWINTAFICMFALFTYPFSLMVLLIQIIFIHVRPFSNPEKLDTVKWAKEVAKFILWVTLAVSLLSVLLFGTTIDKALSDNKPVDYLLLSVRELIADTVMNYVCLGHRFWFFISFIVLPSLISFIKVVIN